MRTAERSGRTSGPGGSAGRTGSHERRGSVAAADDKVVLQHTSHGLGTNGVAYDQTYCFVMTMRDDRIVEIVAYVDTDLLMRIIA